jgi:hypothetical protein
MDKVAIICKLHEIVDHYLLGSGTWPAHWDLLPAFRKTIRDLGLDEEVPDSPGTTRSTPLGKELKLDLMMAFVGAWDLSEIPYVLVEHGYIEEIQAEELWTDSLVDFERKLRWLVLRAYYDFCNRSKWAN